MLVEARAAADINIIFTLGYLKFNIRVGSLAKQGYILLSSVQGVWKEADSEVRTRIK